MRSRRASVVVFLLVAGSLLAAAPAGAGTSVHRQASVSTDAGTWEWITPDLYADAGDSARIEFGSLPRDLRVKWVRCGYAATQDAASSVGGQSVRVFEPGSYTVGTGFRQGACIRIWARVITSFKGLRPTFFITAYLAPPGS